MDVRDIESIKPTIKKKKRTLLQVVMGRKKQTGIEVTWPWDEKGKKKWKRVRLTGRLLRALTFPPAAAAYRYRAALAPWLLALVSFVVVAAARHAQHPVAVALFADVVYGIAGILIWDRARGERQALIAASGLGVAGFWTLLSAIAGPDWRPGRIFLVATFLVWSVPWWNHHRFGGATRAGRVLGDLAAVWALRMRKLAPGTELFGEHPIVVGGKTIGTRALIEVTDDESDLTTTALLQLTERVTAKFKLPIGQVVIDMPDDGRADTASLMVFGTNPLRQRIPYPGSDFDYATGTSTIGLRIDGTTTPYVWCVHGSGALHDLIAGDTGAGKSSLISMLLAISRAAAGAIVDWVIDPQEGQSAPDWVDHVDRFATSATEGMILLQQVLDLMYWRNRFLANCVWTDAKGRERKGFDFFPWMRIGMPLLVVTIFEAHALLQLPGAVKIVEEIAKMARKCGIKLRLEVQVPLIDQLGGSMTLRQQVASGNVIVFRTGGRMTGQVAFNGVLAVDPHAIPKFWPGTEPVHERSTAGVGFVLGADASQMQFRAYVLGDALDYSRAGETWRLPADHYDAAGVWPPAAADVVDAAERLTMVAAGQDPDADTPSQKETAKDLIRAFVAGWDGDGPAQRMEIVAALKGDRGVSTLHGAITAMISAGELTQTADGGLTLKGDQQ